MGLLAVGKCCPVDRCGAAAVMRHTAGSQRCYHQRSEDLALTAVAASQAILSGRVAQPATVGVAAGRARCQRGGGGGGGEVGIISAAIGAPIATPSLFILLAPSHAGPGSAVVMMLVVIVVVTISAVAPTPHTAFVGRKPTEYDQGGGHRDNADDHRDNGGNDNCHR